LKVAALLGYPLAHSITPAMYASAFGAMGLPVRCEKWVTPPAELPAKVERLRGADVLGANVTVPHKERVMALLDGVDPAAARIGAVNCIVREESGRLRGHNTDKYGFLRSLREAGCDPQGVYALLLGAGGAARAVAVGLLEAGAARLVVANRTAERARQMAGEVAPADERVAVVEWGSPVLQQACREADLIVNSTPVGTAQTDIAGESPLSEACFRAGAFAYDLVYNPPETPFLGMARRAGARPITGLEMLVYQGAESIRLWTGREPPVDLMRKAARAALEA
jgi:shikimate dehydrogenase